MQDKYKKLFGYINLIEPPKGLRGNITARIDLEQRRAGRFQFIISSISVVFSLGIMIPIAFYLNNSLSQSGFYQYVALIFSGDSAVYVYWKELASAMVESAPIVGLIVFLSMVALFIWSFTNVMRKDALKYIMNFN
ncbi:MAG: hypothetical protein V1896_00730 [Candidatus Zambryskibacteria bacterium]